MNLLIPLPGLVTGSNAYIDIETRKVDCGVTLHDGWRLKKRWSAFAIGIGGFEGIHLLATYQEEELLAEASKLIGHRVATYAATRQFDEMVLKGQFTNARRAHEPKPFFPALPKCHGHVTQWRNIHREVQQVDLSRGIDIPSKDIPFVWCGSEGDRQYVLMHLLRDVVELMFVDGKVNAEARAWMRRVLFSNDYALSLIRNAMEPDDDTVSG